MRKMKAVLTTRAMKTGMINYKLVDCDELNTKKRAEIKDNIQSPRFNLAKLMKNQRHQHKRSAYTNSWHQQRDT